MTAAHHSDSCSQADGRGGQDPSVHRGRRYTRQKAHARSTVASARIHGRYGWNRAIAIAPPMPKTLTAQGPMQHNPTNDANPLRPMALPVVATTRRCSRMRAACADATIRTRLTGWAFLRPVTTEDATIASQWFEDGFASLTHVKEAAGVGGHDLRNSGAALGTLNGRLKDNLGFHCVRLNPVVTTVSSDAHWRTCKAVRLFGRDDPLLRASPFVAGG